MEEFKREMNRGIWRKLMEVENPLASIKQWYRRVIALDRNWRESRREEGKKGEEFQSRKDRACHDLWCGRGGNHCLSR